MTLESGLKEATAAVDEAWQRWKHDPSAVNETAYDRAYEYWKRLGRVRGVGRPRSGDQSALTSTERAQAGRTRQQQSGARWEKVAPLIQRLRSAVVGADNAEISRIVNSLVKETEMTLTNLQVIHAQPDSDFVVLNGWHGSQMVLAFIPKLHLEDHLKRQRLTGKQANLVVDGHIEAFARIISSKYERGEYRPYSRLGSTYPRVDVTLADIEASSEVITDSVLKISAGWMAQDGRWSST